MEDQTSLQSHELFWNNFDDSNYDFENASTPPENVLMDNDEPSLDQFFGAINTDATLQAYTPLSANGTSFDGVYTDDNFSNPSLSNPYADDFYSLAIAKSKRKTNPLANNETELISGKDANWFDDPMKEASSLSDYISYSPTHSVYDDISRQSYQDPERNWSETHHTMENANMYDSQYENPLADELCGQNVDLTCHNSPLGATGYSKDNRLLDNDVSLGGNSIQQKYERSKSLNNAASRKYRKNKVQNMQNKNEMLTNLEAENSSLRAYIKEAVSLRDECKKKFDIYNKYVGNL